MTEREHKINEVKKAKHFYECMKELYANSTPVGDFDKLMETSPLNQHGQIDIPFNDFSIDEELFKEIIEKHEKKIKPKWKRREFSAGIYLGCSPKLKAK